MFTGIIEEIGTVSRVLPGAQAGSIGIAAREVVSDARIGDSIAVSGVCLTVTSFSADGFAADVMPETLARSNLGRLRAGDAVNLERAMPANGRFGGHIVSGHIDGMGEVVEARPDGNAVRLRIRAASEICALIVEKGSIAIDGVSLTVTDAGDQTFGVSIIPHTGAATTLLRKRAGDVVNLENDIVGKYVERLLARGAARGRSNGEEERAAHAGTSGITLDFLARNGF